MEPGRIATRVPIEQSLSGQKGLDVAAGSCHTTLACHTALASEEYLDHLHIHNRVHTVHGPYVASQVASQVDKAGPGSESHLPLQQSAILS